MKAIAFLAAFTFAQLAVADSEAVKEAEKLMEIVGIETVLEQSTAQMLEIQLSQNPTLIPYKDVMLEFFAKYMSYESLKPQILAMYSEAFSAAELKEINAFYTTEVGKKTIEKMPQLMAQGAQIGAMQVQANLEELQQMIMKEAERLQKLQEQEHTQ